MLVLHREYASVLAMMLATIDHYPTQIEALTTTFSRMSKPCGHVPSNPAKCSKVWVP